LQID